MKIKLSTKFMAIFMIITIIMPLPWLIINRYYMGKFYAYRNEAKIEELSKLVKEKRQNGEELEISELEEKYNVRIEISRMKNEYEIPMMEMMPRGRLEKLRNKGIVDFQHNMMMMRDKNKELFESGKPIIRMLGKEGDRGNGPPKDIFAVTMLDKEKGEVLLIWVSGRQMFESSKIASEFAYLAILISLFISLLLSIFVSRKVAKPVSELKDIAVNMSKLDFSRKIKIKSGDELEELGNAVNELSDELEKKIGELSETNKKLNEELEKERKIERMRREFIANISHELKTPVAIIGGYAEGLKDNIATNVETKEQYLDTIVDESKKMSGIIKKLLELSKLNSDLYAPDIENIKIGELFENIRKRFEGVAEEKGAKFIVEYSPDDEILCDYNLMHEALENFITNAVSFVNENGEIKLINHKDDGKNIIEVFNSGSKIPEERLEDIWLPFFRVEESHNRKFGGTGLGLSISKSIVEKHKGEVKVENKPDGVSFYIIIYC